MSVFVRAVPSTLTPCNYTRRSEFFARAAERWLDALEDEGTTEAINRAIAGVAVDHAFTDAAAAALPAGDQH
jgi:hypothetical protein